MMQQQDFQTFKALGLVLPKVDNGSRETKGLVIRIWGFLTDHRVGFKGNRVLYSGLMTRRPTNKELCCGFSLGKRGFNILPSSHEARRRAYVYVSYRSVFTSLPELI